MMKYRSISILFFFVLLVVQLHAQTETEKKPQLYNPDANAEEDLSAALAVAKESGKHVFIQIGGNWCSWCILFHKFVEEHPAVKEVFNENYVPLRINYSRENENEEMMAKLGFPGRFGFPVFVILDADGNRLHTQDSALLELGKGYDEKKVIRFFKNWSAKAVDPASYMKE